MSLTHGGAAAMNNTTIVLDAFYESMQVIEILQFRGMTTEALFANIGGLLGLWVSCLLPDFRTQSKAAVFS